MGHQAFLESRRRHPAHQTLVDSDHATAHRCLTGRRSVLAALFAYGTMDAGILLATGIQQCYARHRGRRILHATAHATRAIALRRHQEYILQGIDHRGTGSAADGGRHARGVHPQPAEGLEHYVRAFGRHVRPALRLPQILRTAAATKRHRGDGKRQADVQGLHRHLHQFLPQAGSSGRHRLHAAVPSA